jgi:hypothetical protein
LAYIALLPPEDLSPLHETREGVEKVIPALGYLRRKHPTSKHVAKELAHFATAGYQAEAVTLYSRRTILP